MKLKKKKVMIFLDRWASGGIESFIVNLLENSDSSKYEFTVVTSTKESTLFDKRIENLNIQFIVLLKGFSKWYIRPWIMFDKFKKFIKLNTFDVYHFHIYNAVSLIFPSVVINKSKVIIHSHNADVAHDNTRIIKLLVHKFAKATLLRKKYQLVAVSNLAGKWMYGNNKFLIINNGIDNKKFKFSESQRLIYREKFQIDKQSIVFLNIGRLNEQKNQILFINILKMIKKNSTKKIKGIIVGDGPLLNILNLEIKANNLEDCISILSGRNDIEDIASMSDVFLLPSIYEGLPIVGVEMQSNGLLCFFSSNVDKAVQITDKSFFININDSPEQLAENVFEKLDYLNLSNRKKYNSVVNKEGYGIDNTVKNIINLYEEN